MLKRNKLSSLINKTLYKGFVGGGLVIGALTLSACGGGGGGADNDPEVTSLKVYQSTTQLADGQADYVLDGDSANIEYWMDETTGKVTQTLYTSDNGVTKIRTIVDSDGVPTKIIDELTGSYVVVEDTGNDRVNYYTYDANDIYQSGVAVYVENSKIYYATISGIPANLSGQYAGQLQGLSKRAAIP